MLISTEETISDYQRIDSSYGAFGINSHCSSASTSTVSSYTASADTGIFHGQRLQFCNRINGKGEGRTELVGSKYPLKQRKDTNTKSTSVNKSIRCIFEKLGWLLLRKETGNSRTSIEKHHTSVLGLTEAKYKMVVSIQLNPRAKSTQVQMDNIVAPSLLDQNGGTKNNILSQMSNGI